MVEWMVSGLPGKGERGEEERFAKPPLRHSARAALAHVPVDTPAVFLARTKLRKLASSLNVNRLPSSKPTEQY